MRWLSRKCFWKNFRVHLPAFGKWLFRLDFSRFYNEQSVCAHWRHGMVKFFWFLKSKTHRTGFWLQSKQAILGLRLAPPGWLEGDRNVMFHETLRRSFTRSFGTSIGRDQGCSHRRFRHALNGGANLSGIKFALIFPEESQRSSLGSNVTSTDWIPLGIHRGVIMHRFQFILSFKTDLDKTLFRPRPVQISTRPTCSVEWHSNSLWNDQLVLWFAYVHPILVVWNQSQAKPAQFHSMWPRFAV